MRRREFMTVVGGAATFIPLSAWAQQSQPPLIGVLNAASAETMASSIEALRAALSRLGYVEGRNIRFEFRYADGFLDRLPALAEELVQLNPRVIVSGPLPASLAVRKVTATIPIVMSTGADPVGFGLVQSLSHPGGNVTGLSNFAEELASKQIDVIRELLPHVARVAALVNVANPLHLPQLRETQAAAAKASLALVQFEFRVPADLARAFAEFVSAKAEALLVPPDITFGTHRVRIAELAAEARLPAIYGDRRAVESGGLLSYGPNVVENYRRSAAYFTESICVQCGLCEATCPEDAITLVPRLDFQAWNAPQRILKEEDPFECIVCGKPFGTKSTIERVVAKLEGKHWMFHGDNARRIDVVKMCENCRVAAVVNEGFDPHTAQRPAPVTTDDYLRAREAQKATRPDRKERTRSRLAATGRSSVERRCVRH